MKACHIVTITSHTGMKLEEEKMDESLKPIWGLDQNKEIFSLWYEITYLRILLNHIVQSNPSLSHCLNADTLSAAKRMAQREICVKFPLVKLDFKDPEIVEEVLPEASGDAH